MAVVVPALADPAEVFVTALAVAFGLVGEVGCLIATAIRCT
jgi:hypothetical protein